MGGTSSKTTSETITDIITNVAVKDMQQCASFIAQDQIITVSGNGNIVSDVRMVQAATINMECYQKSRNIIDIQNAIVNSLNQAAASKASGFPTLDSGTKSATYSKIINNIRNDITMEMIQNCVATINQKQAIYISGNRNITMNVAMEQTASQLKNCLAERIMQTSVGTEIQNLVKQEAASETKSPFSFITDIFGGMMNTIILIVGAIVLIIVFAIVGPSFGDSDDDDDEYTQRQRIYAEMMQAGVAQGVQTPTPPQYQSIQYQPMQYQPMQTPQPTVQQYQPVQLPQQYQPQPSVQPTPSVQSQPQPSAQSSMQFQ